MADSVHDHAITNGRTLDKKLDTAGWGLFFIWLGIALLADVGWGVGLLGVGIITLGMQAVRAHFGLPIEGFWLVVGILFAVGGMWILLTAYLGGAPIPGGLIPILSLVVGIVLFASALLHRRD